MAMNYKAISLLFLVGFITSRTNDVSSFLFVIASPQNSKSHQLNVNSRTLVPPIPSGGSLAVQTSNATSHNDTSSFFYKTMAGESDGEKELFVSDSSSSSIATMSSSTDSSPQLSKKRNLKVLFLSADTGGGHRASAESLANQFLKKYPGSEYTLVDVWTPIKVFPYYTLVPSYKHLSAHPRQWKTLYHVSNTRWYEKLTNIHSKYFAYHDIEKQLEEFDADVVVSVHPTMNYVPMLAMRNIAKKRGKYIPFFTVVTDFGSAHCTWFQNGVDKMYIASKRIYKLAKRRGKVSDDKIVMTGLPIREGFADQAEKIGDRTSPQGKLYQKKMKETIGINPEKKMVLVMGGGEGVGSLSTITRKLHERLREEGIDATICVVCGRNEILRKELETTDWDSLHDLTMSKTKKGKIKSAFKRILLGKKGKQVKTGPRKGSVDVVGLGFVTNMDEHMVAADILVSKAGPGTIAEAAAVGLPIMITSFLPGQEAGNVDIVLDGGFGDFRIRPKKIAEGVASWLLDEEKLNKMSELSTAAGNPYAASDIVEDIGRITLQYIERDLKTAS